MGTDEVVEGGGGYRNACLEGETVLRGEEQYAEAPLEYAK